MHYGPKWGQTDKWGKYKCKTKSFANGGLKRRKKSKKNDTKNTDCEK